MSVFLKLWNRIANFGKIVVTPEQVEGVIVQDFYATSLELLRQTALAEYHDAMAAMLYHRRQRLHKDPFNTRFFEGQEREEDFEAANLPPAPKKDGGPTGPLTH